MKITRKWAMPNRWTFTIKPIKEFISRNGASGLFKTGKWVDPFCGKNSPADITNDLNPNIKADFNMDALKFLKTIKRESIDGAFFDPPYSFSQVKKCYEGIGIPMGTALTRMDYWSQCKDEFARILKPCGKMFCFGWNSNGIGKTRGFEMKEILLVVHGGNKNDTICTYEIKLNS